MVSAQSKAMTAIFQLQQMKVARLIRLCVYTETYASLGAYALLAYDLRFFCYRLHQHDNAAKHIFVS